MMDSKEERIAEIQEILERSQKANCYPDEYEESDRLTRKQHFELWDEMWSLMVNNSNGQLPKQT